MLEIKITGNTADELADSMAELSKLNAVTNVGRQVLLAQQAAQQTQVQPADMRESEAPSECAGPTPGALSSAPADDEPTASAAVHKALEENNLMLGEVKGTGKNGRVTVADVKAHVASTQTEDERSTPDPEPVDEPEVQHAKSEVVDFKVPADVDEARTMLFALHKEAGQKACVDVIAGCDIKQIGELTEDKFELYGKLVADEIAKAG